MNARIIRAVRNRRRTPTHLRGFGDLRLRLPRLLRRERQCLCGAPLLKRRLQRLLSDQVFPWLHGLSADNALQLAYFNLRNKALPKVPGCVRGITIVKTGGNLDTSRLGGALAPDELLPPRPAADAFAQHEPPKGFSVRNFQIQACKMATVSDIVVYGDEKTPLEESIALAQRISRAQRAHEASTGTQRGLFNTFILQGPCFFTWTRHALTVQNLLAKSRNATRAWLPSIRPATRLGPS